MRNKVVIPFFLIMLVAIIVTIGISIKGVGDEKEIASGKEKAKAETVAFKPEDFYQQTCAGCHGEKYEGKVGPSLKGIGKEDDAAELKNILKNGKPGGMPSGLVPDDKIDQMVDFLTKL